MGWTEKAGDRSTGPKTAILMPAESTMLVSEAWFVLSQALARSERQDSQDAARKSWDMQPFMTQSLNH
jgi:hypothetical protein